MSEEGEWGREKGNTHNLVFRQQQENIYWGGVHKETERYRQPRAGKNDVYVRIGAKQAEEGAGKSGGQKQKSRESNKRDRERRHTRAKRKRKEEDTGVTHTKRPTDSGGRRPQHHTRASDTNRASK